MNARVILIAGMWAMIAAGPSVATEPQNDPRPLAHVSSPHRSLTDIRLDVHAALRAESISRRQGPNGPEVIRLVNLYLELAAHPKRDQSPLVRELGSQLRSRLKNVSEHIERQGGDHQRPAKKEPVAALVASETQVLAQQGVVAGGVPAGQGAPPAGQFGAAQVIDFGPQLVELIQQTISPGTWDINGGNGSIVYHAPLRVLVVRAPATVHGQIGGVLGPLRVGP